MNNIQKIIKELEDDRKKVREEMFECMKVKNFNMSSYLAGISDAFFISIKKLTLLLNTENENGGKKDSENDGKLVI